MNQEDILEQLAEVAGFALAGRPERVEDGMVALAAPEFRTALRDVRELLAVVALASPRTAPSNDVRHRLLQTLSRSKTRRALLVIDMIRDHLDPGALLEVPRARDIVPALKARLDEARAAGIPVVYVVDEHDADDPDLDAWGTHAVKGSAGTEVWPELAPTAADIVVKKPSYSAFFQTELEAKLEELEVDTLVLTGCLTEIGIMATATDAMQRGFAVEVPPDSQAGAAVELERAAMGTMNVMAPFGPTRRARLDRLAA